MIEMTRRRLIITAGVSLLLALIGFGVYRYAANEMKRKQLATEWHTWRVTFSSPRGMQSEISIDVREANNIIPLIEAALRPYIGRALADANESRVCHVRLDKEWVSRYDDHNMEAELRREHGAGATVTCVMTTSRSVHLNRYIFRDSQHRWCLGFDGNDWPTDANAPGVTIYGSQWQTAAYQLRVDMIQAQQLTDSLIDANYYVGDR